MAPCNGTTSTPPMAPHRLPQSWSSPSPPTLQWHPAMAPRPLRQNWPSPPPTIAPCNATVHSPKVGHHPPHNHNHGTLPQWHPTKASSNGTTSTAPCNGTQQWHHVHSTKAHHNGTLQRHPALAPRPLNHSTLQWHPAMAPHPLRQWHHVHSPKVGRHPPPQPWHTTMAPHHVHSTTAHHNGTLQRHPALAPRPINHSTLQWHPAMAPRPLNHSTPQWHPAMAPSNGTTSTAPCNGILVPRPMRKSGSSPSPPIGSKNPYSYRYLGKKCTEQMWSTVALIKTNYCINYFIHFLQFPFFCRSSARFQTTQWWLKVWVKQLSSTFLDSLNAFTVIRGISFPSLAISAVRGELGIMSWGESWGRGICKRQTWGSPIGQKCFGCWR